MRFAVALAADLAALTVALDDPEADVASGVREFGAAAAAAVATYLGLSVIVSQSDSAFAFTVIVDGGTADDVRTSISLAMKPPCELAAVPEVVFILYAGSPGAFVDLAADLAWLTGRSPADFPLDAHLHVPGGADGAVPLDVGSVVNQAIGVLIDRGLTLDQALRELDTRVTVAGTDRPSVARVILDTLPSGTDQQIGCDADNR